jgi:hypothetical protein
MALHRRGDGLKRVIGAPNSIYITPGPNQVLFIGESTYPRRILNVALDGKVLGVIGRSGRNLGQFCGAHALACPSEHEIYAAETSNWRVQKLLLHQLTRLAPTAARVAISCSDQRCLRPRPGSKQGLRA